MHDKVPFYSSWLAFSADFSFRFVFASYYEGRTPKHCTGIFYGFLCFTCIRLNRRESSSRSNNNILSMRWPAHPCPELNTKSLSINQLTIWHENYFKRKHHRAGQIIVQLTVGLIPGARCTAPDPGQQPLYWTTYFTSSTRNSTRKEYDRCRLPAEWSLGRATGVNRIFVFFSSTFSEVVAVVCLPSPIEFCCLQNFSKFQGLISRSSH